MNAREEKIRRQLQEVIRRKDLEHTWVTGRVTFALASGAEITGQLLHLEPASAVIDGPRGRQSVVLKNVRG